jgi:hypothetical protein
MAADTPGSSQFSSVTPEQVEELHKNADTDVRKEAIHHTLGPRGSQAAAGDHKHDGSDSALLLEGLTVTGSRASSASITPSIIAALVKLGMTDSSTA